MNEKQATEIVNHLDALKKLMVLNLLEKGFSQNQIALTLGVRQATISRMFPSGVLKKPKSKPNVGD